MKNKCLSELTLNASGKLQPQILKAIELFVNNGIYEINANMVRDRCISMNSTVNWSGRLPAICNGMRNTSACGAKITSEDRDFGGFTIRFGAGDTPLRDTSNSHSPQIKPLKASNKTPDKTMKSKITQAEFIDALVNTLYVFSPEGRKRIYNDLTQVNSQLLCKGQLNGQLIKGVTAFGKPNRVLIENQIKKKYNNTNFIDNDIKWELTSGVKFNIDETRKAVKILLIYLCKFHNNDHFENMIFIEKFLFELRGNKNSLFSMLSPLKYKSKIAGSKLVGKQTPSSNINDLGYVDEHVIPVKFYISKFLSLIKSKSVESEIDTVMTKLFVVKLNTDDDIKLKKSGLNIKMPPNWTWEDDPLERYWFAKIDKNSLLKI